MRAEVLQMVRETCAVELAELKDIIEWARSERRRQQRREEAWERIRGTVIGQCILWAFIGSGYVIYTAAQHWLSQIRGGSGT